MTTLIIFLIRFCQLIVWTLPTNSQTNETFISLDQSYIQTSNTDGSDGIPMRKCFCFFLFAVNK